MTGRTMGEPKGPSERSNQRLLMWSGALGGAIGLGTALALIWERAPGEPMPSLLTAPLPAWVAILVVIAWGVVLPVIAWRWHQVVDEHERQAFRDGAIAGFYVMGVGAPVWWFLWRGRLAPAVDAVWLYVATVAVTGAVWLWRKYA